MSSTESITYSSTRGGEKGLDFRTVVMQGLARDRGLFVPDDMPAVSPQELASWRALAYADLAVNVIRKFVKDDQIPEAKLREIVHRSCGAFRHEDVTPVVPVAGHAILVCSQCFVSPQCVKGVPSPTHYSHVNSFLPRLVL
jgi:threonine synthase